MPPEPIGSFVVVVPDVIQVTKKKEIKAKKLALIGENQRARKEAEKLVNITSDQFL